MSSKLIEYRLVRVSKKVEECYVMAPEWQQSRIYWHKATPDETLDHIEDYINKQE